MFLDPTRAEIAKHFDYYEGKLDSLFNRLTPSAVNGLGIIGAENINTRFNYFQSLSNFFSTAVEGDLPSVASPEVSRLINQAAEHWSVANEICLVGTPGAVSLVRPDYVYPLYSRYNKDVIERILFIYPERDQAVPNFDNELLGTNKALVVEYNVATGEAFQSIRGYSVGNVDDEPRGEQIDIGIVRYIKTGPLIYPKVESIIREICVRLNMLQLALNTTALPILQIKKDEINDGQLTGTDITLNDIKRLATGPLGVNVPPPFSGESEASYVERAGRGLDESLDYVKMLISQLSVLSSVPEHVFGLNMGQPNAITDRVLFSASAKVNQFRRLLDEALREYNIEVEFTDTPFSTPTDRSKIVMEQLAAGIISVEEARSKLNLN